MKKRMKKWALRLTVTGLFIAGLLIIILLNPILTYASKTTYNSYTIYHNKPLDKSLTICLDGATTLVQKNDLYTPTLKLDICLNEGSQYTALIENIGGRAFAWGFYNKVVLMGTAHPDSNYVELNGYKWNMTQLLAHEMIHCYQYKALGLLNSNPVAHYPHWKWEGYPEYVARQNSDQKDLTKNITHLLQTEKTNNNGWIQFADSTGTVIPYYKSLLMMQYCLDIKKMTYKQVLADKATEECVWNEMMLWYEKQLKITN